VIVQPVPSVAPAKKGKGAPQPQVKINKQQANKVSRQMENAGKYLSHLIAASMIERCALSF
jgi:hypothetical protein